MTPEKVESLFTRSDGSFQFARWARPLAPVVFGTDDASIGALKGAIRDVAALGDLRLVDTDPELGANLLIFFVSDWSELDGVAHLDRLVPDLSQLLDRLTQAGANQYRSFRFDADGAIRLCLIFLRYDADLAAVSARTLAVAQMAQSMLLWSDTAFRAESPVAVLAKGGEAIVRPEVAALIRAAYDPVLPAASRTPAHAHRLAARARLLLGDLADDA
ncbi:hypothetical protein HMH01_12555 [Halovulum dunhuangense]|uniref:Uncharacterized protein n=1 Tax=Halovulum dunhuangense TaxID=1505036 RepID=A0A849L4B3_9RHOB|nr:hypothetical protein [Halovulum dunhuangense]NNU81268.1 hypothetical protein [Halovulum dunhuangense]